MDGIIHITSYARAPRIETAQPLLSPAEIKGKSVTDHQQDT